MILFLGIFHGKCYLRYVEGFLEFRKLDLRGFKGQFDVKNVDFWGLIAKIGHYRRILASKPTYDYLATTLSFRIPQTYLSRG